MRCIGPGYDRARDCRQNPAGFDCAAGRNDALIGALLDGASLLVR
jgi:hypothetical protein